MAIQVAIEGYDSLEQIGIGGMAAVYRARKVSIDKTVAIKLLFPYLATDSTFIERFQREAKAAASIQHENIVNVIDFGESDGAFFIVMEYYDGRTLEQLMKERPGLPPEIAVQILLEVAIGLEAAHALDIVHRDIKPANIIFTNQGGIKIADFGLARKSDSMSMITQHGKVLGTPAYMSPEQAAGRPVGPASDIFSFGVVAYELFGRRRPFEGQTYSEVLDKIQTHDPAPVTISNPLVSPEVEAIIHRALAKEETSRYRSATELIAELEAAMDKNQVTRDRRRLASYARDPDQYEAGFAESTVTHCLSRGAFFMQKGNTHLKDAVLEYRRVLFIDPGHERARANLAKLGSDPDDDTPSRAPEAAVANEPTRLMPAVAGARRDTAVAARRKIPRWMPGTAAVIALGASAYVYTILSTPEVSTDPAGMAQALLDTTGVGVAARGQSGPEPMTASATDAAGAPLMDATVTKRATPAATETASAHPKRTPTKATQKDARDSTSLARDVSMRKPPATKTEAPAQPPAPAQEPPASPGSLSVYFLGGVGELWVDGRLFAYQPPFERATLAAGVHRIACRMSGESARRELTVTIEPGAETVIEYEIGKEPAVVEE